MIIIFYIVSIVITPFKMYAYTYKKELKHYENDLEFQWVYQDFKNIFYFT